eukprot:364447-Chlamydomonas_euryale.AAC.17
MAATWLHGLLKQGGVEWSSSMTPTPHVCMEQGWLATSRHAVHVRRCLCLFYPHRMYLRQPGYLDGLPLGLLPQEVCLIMHDLPTLCATYPRPTHTDMHERTHISCVPCRAGAPPCAGGPGRSRAPGAGPLLPRRSVARLTA